MRASVVAMAVILGAQSPAWAAEPIGFLICQPGGPELSTEQQEVMDRLFRHLEDKLGFAEGRIQGHYANTKKRCDKALAKKPAVIFPSVPFYLENKAALKLQPVAQLRINGGTRDNFYVLTSVKNDFKVADLADKAVTGTDLGSPRFISDVVFGGQLKPDQLKLKPTKRALKGVRNAARGKVGAVVLSGTEYRALASSKHWKKLRLVHTSPAVPTAPVTVVPQRVAKGFGRRLSKALVGMRTDPQGQKVLKTFNIEGFDATSSQQWAQLEARLRTL